MRNILYCLLFLPFVLYSQYGILDDTFGNNGIAIHENNLPDEVNGRWSMAMTIDQNQNIFTGTNYNYSPDLTAFNDNILIGKFFPDGQLNTAFADNGFKKINISNGLIYVYDILTSHDNYIYVLGGVFLNASNERKALVIKLDTDGNFVSGFGNNGMAFFSIEGGANTSSFLETHEHEFVIGGNYSRNDTGTPGLYLMKINANGDLVSSFGNGGILKYNYSNFDVLRDLKLNPDGSLIVLDYILNNQGTYNYVLAKFNSNGTLDTSFNQSGTRVIPLSDGNLYDFSSIELKPDGKILYSANNLVGTVYWMEITEFMPDGTVNFNFGNNGTVSTHLENLVSGNFTQYQRTFKVTPNGQHLIQIGFALENNEPYTKFVLLGLDGNGNYDSQFGNNGVTLTKIHPSLHDEPTKATFIGNDRLLVLNGTHLSLACYKIYEGLSIEEISVNSKIQIAPNPTSNSFVIKGLSRNKNQVQILDFSGIMIREFSGISDNQMLDLGLIPKGIYLIRIQSEGFVETKKLIVK